MNEDHIEKVVEYLEMILTDMTGVVESLEQIKKELKEMEADNGREDQTDR